MGTLHATYVNFDKYLAKFFLEQCILQSCRENQKKI